MLQAVQISSKRSLNTRIMCFRLNFGVWTLRVCCYIVRFIILANNLDQICPATSLEVLRESQDGFKRVTCHLKHPGKLDGKLECISGDTKPKNFELFCFLKLAWFFGQKDFLGLIVRISSNINIVYYTWQTSRNDLMLSLAAFHLGPVWLRR